MWSTLLDEREIRPVAYTSIVCGVAVGAQCSSAVELPVIIGDFP
jgi:hypothetical protein